MTTLEESEIKAITKLLKDSDVETIKLLEEQLRKLDEQILYKINNYIPENDLFLKNSYLSLIHKIKREKIEKKLSLWVNSKNQDLEEAILLISEFDDPFFDKNYYTKLLDNWSEKLTDNLEEVILSKEPSSIINEINHFLFMELGFQGNKENYYSSDNSYLTKVIDSKLGNPISLSVIYLLITKRINLHFEGVALPAHFIIKYSDKAESIFVDPFNQGEIITKDDCKKRVSALKLPWTEDYLVAPSNKSIVKRILQNLINIYHSEGEYILKEWIERYLEILNK